MRRPKTCWTIRSLAVAPVPSVSDGRNAGHGRTTGAAELDSGMQSTPRLGGCAAEGALVGGGGGCVCRHSQRVARQGRAGQERAFDRCGRLRSRRGVALFAGALSGVLRVRRFAKDDECFIGATPERIVHKKDGHVRVACMAGSIARGVTPGEDERLGRELLNDAKNMEEHRIVLRSILEALAPVCADVVAAERTGLRKLANVQHLYTPVTALVGGATQALASVARCVFDRAIGGWPMDKALALIREKEGMERGWMPAPSAGWTAVATASLPWGCVRRWCRASRRCCLPAAALWAIRCGSEYEERC